LNVILLEEKVEFSSLGMGLSIGNHGAFLVMEFVQLW
jgi:hypothetical protein